MAAALIKHEQITTTVAKAKELRPYVEKLVTLAKKGGLSNRRIAHSRIMDEAQERKLFEVLGPRYADAQRRLHAGRQGGHPDVRRGADRDHRVRRSRRSAKGQDSGPVEADEEFEDA
jgi:large subunit ribosomal protein L17